MQKTFITIGILSFIGIWLVLGLSIYFDKLKEAGTYIYFLFSLCPMMFTANALFCIPEIELYRKINRKINPIEFYIVTTLLFIVSSIPMSIMIYKLIEKI
jgi:hypothetical protein